MWGRRALQWRTQTRKRMTKSCLNSSQKYFSKCKTISSRSKKISLHSSECRTSPCMKTQSVNDKQLRIKAMTRASDKPKRLPSRAPKWKTTRRCARPRVMTTRNSCDWQCNRTTSRSSQKARTKSTLTIRLISGTWLTHSRTTRRTKSRNRSPKRMQTQLSSLEKWTRLRGTSSRTRPRIQKRRKSTVIRPR